MLRYQFLDIEVIIKKTLVFAGLLSFVFGVFAAVSFLLQDVLSTYAGVNRALSLFISVVVIVLGYDRLRAWLVHITENVLFQKEIDYEALDLEIADQIQITNLNEQVRNIAEIFQTGFSLENAAIFLFDDEKKIFRLAHEVGYGRMAEAEGILEGSLPIEFFRRYSQAVILKSVLAASPKPEIEEFMNEWKTEAVCKITFKDRLIAFLLLGRKKSDRDYGQKDVDFLDKVSKGLAVSINNATTFKMKENYYALQAQRNRIEMVAQLSLGIDHEIKNPLNQILPRLELIQRWCREISFRPEHERLPVFTDECIHHVGRIISIMDRLRKFAHPVESRNLKLCPIRVRPVVEEAVGLVSDKQLEIDNVIITNKVGEDTRVFAEETSLVQVFYNLINNAYHAISRNGSIDIFENSNVQEGRVVICVSDTGPGIPAENINKIFDPFFTTKPTNLPQDGKGPRFKGTGLGLSFVKKYMEDLGGSITVASEPGKGTSFFLKFLRAEAV